MKYSFAVLVMLAMLAALPASKAWSAEDSPEQCMETCLDPAIESGDPDVIDAAITRCVAQCSPANDSGPALGTVSNFLTHCLTDCSSRHQECLLAVGYPLKCQIVSENCRRACYR